jgi:hypothetical protein
MYSESPFFQTPENKDAKIWRYMDIAKFLSLLNNQALHFTRSDLLDDRFEGSIPCSEEQKALNIKSSEFLLDWEYPDSTDPIRTKAKNYIKEAMKSHPFHDKDSGLKKSVYVCCFNMSEFESAALWSLYSKDNQGVAIQSTFNRLCNCFNDYKENTVLIGLINYIDYTKQTLEVKNPVVRKIEIANLVGLPPNNYPLLRFLHKRKSFEHEHELRALIAFPKELQEFYQPPLDKIDQSPVDLTIPVNLEILIEKIYIAPESPSWIKGLLTSVLKKYGINKIPWESDLDKDPVF